MSTTMKELSLDQLIEGRQKPLKNASDLIEEAEILLNSHRWARAVFLACIAIEELGKYLIIMGAIGRVLTGNMDWKKFWKRFRSHEEKTGNIMVFDAMIGPFVSAEDTLASVRRAKRHTSDQEKEKLNSLYVDCTAEGFVLPMDHVNEKDANKAVESAKAVLRFFREMENHVFSDMCADSIKPEMFADYEKWLQMLGGKADDSDNTAQKGP